MRLKTFVSDTIKEIIDAVVDSQNYARKHNAKISPMSLSGALHAEKLENVFYDKYTGRYGQLIEFDVAIHALEEKGKGAKAGIGIHVLKASVGGESKLISSTTNRIKFTIPVMLPIHETVVEINELKKKLGPTARVYIDKDK